MRDKVSHVVDQHLVDFVSAKGGSIAGEHGVGLQRKNQLAFARSPEMIHAMKLIKQAFDPNQIMNPYKVFPDTDTKL